MDESKHHSAEILQRNKECVICEVNFRHDMIAIEKSGMRESAQYIV